MVLSMSRPWKHPVTGFYYFRKAVPKDLRFLVGKYEEKRSLGTKDPVEAKAKFIVVAACIAAEWAELRRRNVALALPALAELDEPTIRRAGEAYFAHLLEEDEEQRIDGFETSERPTMVITESGTGEIARLLKEQGFKAPTFETYDAAKADHEEALRHAYARGLTDDFFDTEVDEVLSWEGFEIKLDPSSPSRKRLARELQAATIRATAAIRERNRGVLVDTPTYPVPVAKPAATSTTTQSLTALLEDWWREAKAVGRKPSTYESYRNTINAFAVFLGHDAADRVEPRHVVDFKDHRLASTNPRTGQPISPKTVKDSDLAALKTIFGWAATNHRLPSNPASGITIKLGKQRRLRSKGFSNDEAQSLLRAAREHRQGHESAKTFAAKRWVPWLCAYTGARVGEIAQLRKQDIKHLEGAYVIHITPEAGTVKTDEARDVVLHADLVAEGFLTFVDDCAAGHLFLEPAKTGDVRGPLRGLKNRLAEFARLTVSDPHVKPNHGWRHRFKTLWREAGLDPRIMDAIQGHSAKTVSDTYGDVTIRAQAAALAKFPSEAPAQETPRYAIA